MKNLKDKVAAITGAGSGIGQATAIGLAKEGCHLAISDINKEGLDNTFQAANQLGVNVSTHIVDVADRDSVHNYADEVIKEHGSVNIIINNAGVNLTADVDQMKYEDLEWIMNINFWGVVYGTKEFLPHIRKAGEGHIVNISSLFGIVSVATQAGYNASKFAVRGFTEALRMDLEIFDKNISATSIHPGGIKTDIIKNSRIVTKRGLFRNRDKAVRAFEKGSHTTANQAAAKIIRGIKKNKRRVLIGWDAIIIDISQRLFPSGYQKRAIKRSKQYLIDKNK
ncbi:MAG: SDR family oxidoreductase [Planctomycetes bacterium]|nr:SDR family oxidoreductase [Planctomycetota bacterium]